MALSVDSIFGLGLHELSVEQLEALETIHYHCIKIINKEKIEREIETEKLKHEELQKLEKQLIQKKLQTDQQSSKN